MADANILNLIDYCVPKEVRLVEQDKNQPGFWKNHGDENWKLCSIKSDVQCQLKPITDDASFHLSVGSVFHYLCQKWKVIDLVKNSMRILKCNIMYLLKR